MMPLKRTRCQKLKRLDIIAQAVEKMKGQVASVKTCEIFAYRPAAYSRAKIVFVWFQSPRPTGHASGVHWRAQEGSQLVE